MERDFSRFSIRNVFFFMILEGPTVRYFNHITICLAIIVLRNGLVLGKEQEINIGNVFSCFWSSYSTRYFIDQSRRR